ncbi:MAG: cytochrome c [Bacteroidetes bacterium]|nr:MAG: cytochrome c [Bacteroidota bacterium]
MKKTLNILLVIILFFLIGMTYGIKRDYLSRNSQILPGMVTSVPYNAQDENENFADGKTLQYRKEGQISRELMPLHYQATPEDAKRAGEELFNPVSDTVEGNLERGQAVFTTFCQPCHGTGGLGDGTVVKKGFPAPPSLLAENARKIKDGQMFHIVTYGQGNMPSLASQVSRLDRWKTILYISEVQKKTLTTAK